MDYHTNRVTVKTKEQLTPLLGETQPKIVSDQNVAILARQLALHANVSSFRIIRRNFQTNQKQNQRIDKSKRIFVVNSRKAVKVCLQQK